MDNLKDFEKKVNDLKMTKGALVRQLYYKTKSEEKYQSIAGVAVKKLNDISTGHYTSVECKQSAISALEDISRFSDIMNVEKMHAQTWREGIKQLIEKKEFKVLKEELLNLICKDFDKNNITYKITKSDIDWTVNIQ